jgi:ATP-dependent Lon protease
VGGDILFIETTRCPARAISRSPGQLGDVMKESAKAALSYVKSHAAELGVDVDALKEQDLHIHVPQGAVPKDGPQRGRDDVHGAHVAALAGAGCAATRR